MTSTHETKNVLLFADKTSDRNCPMMGDQQVIDPPQVLSGKGTSAAHGAPPKWSIDQERRLTPRVSS